MQHMMNVCKNKMIRTFLIFTPELTFRWLKNIQNSLDRSSYNGLAIFNNNWSFD